METENFEVNNVKCGGCVANIENGIGEMQGVSKVVVEQASGAVSVEGTGLDRAELAAKLSELGYPEK